MENITWPAAVVIVAAIVGGVLFFGLVITERWPWR